MVRRLRVGVLGLLAGALICALLAAPALATPRLKHAWVVVLENHSVGQILGNSQAPYLNRLARRNGLATRYYSLSHPSLPNYLAMLSGSTQGCGSDSCKPGYGGPLLTRQLRHRGLAWRGYFQGLPHAGYVGGDHGSYVQHHNPFTYFNAIVHSHKARHNILPLSRFRRGLRHPAAFNLVVPDNQHNMHTGSIRESDRWLQHWIPQITHSRAFRRRSVIFITFDEGHNDSSGCCVKGVHGGRTVLIAVTSHRHRVRIQKPRSAYSLLRTVESGFRLPAIGHAKHAPPLNAFWH